MDQKTIQTYNQFAKEYDEETVDFWKKFPKTFIDKFTKLAQGKVINIGSGPGRDALILKQGGLDVVCLDASEVMVKISQEKGLESIVGDFNKIPFEDETFGGAWAYTSLLHVPKQIIGISLQEIWRVLKPGAVLGLGMIEGDTEGYKNTLKEIRENAPRWFSYYKKEELEKLLGEHGFEILYLETLRPRTKNYFFFIAKKI
ncbi:MAG: class I SAM-dependent methyltransferase [bacterium]|nr:class I SAM-dependent methyltransferase [bacterium]